MLMKVKEGIKDDIWNEINCSEFNVLTNIRKTGGEDKFQLRRNKK